MTLPATSEKRLQLVPNSYDRGMPETTPMAKATAKILVQNRASVWKWGWPVRRQSTRSVAINAETPMLKAGKMMWKLMVKANCRRASSRA